MDVKKILWPTDLSGSAKQALKYVQSITEKYQAEIHVMYVIEDIAHHRGLYGNFTQDHIEKIIAWENKKAKERLDDICSQYLEGCPLYIKHVAVGDPAEEILKLIEKEGIDMVIISTKGARGIFVFGSVAEKVVKNSPVPVVTVPPSGEPIEEEAVV
jgi:nucleotide-binding universal stress UspA family protein